MGKDAYMESAKRQAQIEARLREIPPKYRKLYLKAVAGSRPAAVRCQCLECMAWVKAEVCDCTDLGCPLYAVRPYRPRTVERRSKRPQVSRQVTHTAT